MNQPIAIVLGGTEPHAHLIDRLKARGYYTILIDYYESPPAKTFADEHSQISTLDREAVLSLAREINASIVICSCVDQANVIACSVSEKLGLPCAYNSDTAHKATNKVLMKQVLVDHGIPTARHKIFSKNDPLNTGDLDYPLIAKPVDSNSSKGIRELHSPSDLEESATYAQSFSRDGRILIEEFIRGREIGADGLILNGKAHLITTKERRKISSDTKAQQIYGSFWPAPISSDEESLIAKLIQQIADAFQLRNTPIVLQSILKDGKASVIEFGARIGGGDNFRIIKHATGVDMIEHSIDTWLGRSTEFSFQKSPFVYADNYLYSLGGTMGRIVGLEELVESGEIEYFSQYKVHGAKLQAELHSNHRIGVFTLKAPSTEQLQEKIAQILAKIDILDPEGNSIMRRDIY